MSSRILCFVCIICLKPKHSSIQSYGIMSSCKEILDSDDSLQEKLSSLQQVVSRLKASSKSEFFAAKGTVALYCLISCGN